MPLVIHVSEHGFLLCHCLFGLYIREKGEKRREYTQSWEEQEIQLEPYDI